MRRAASLASALCLAAALAVGGAARATVLYDPGVEALVRRAYAVALVVPTAERVARWESGRVVTTARVMVRATLRGPALTEALDIDLPGGVVGDVAQRVEGAPALDPGAPVVVLLHRLSSGRLTVLDLSLGVLPLRAGPDGGPVVMPARVEGLELLRPVAPPSRSIPAEGEPLARFAAWAAGLPR